MAQDSLAVKYAHATRHPALWGVELGIGTGLGMVLASHLLRCSGEVAFAVSLLGAALAGRTIVGIAERQFPEKEGPTPWFFSRREVTAVLIAAGLGGLLAPLKDLRRLTGALVLPVLPLGVVRLARAGDLGHRVKLATMRPTEEDRRYLEGMRKRGEAQRAERERQAALKKARG